MRLIEDLKDSLSKRLADGLVVGLILVFSLLLAWFAQGVIQPILPQLHPQLVAWLIALLLALLCSGCAWIIYLYIQINKKPPTAADYGWDERYGVHLDKKTDARYCPTCLIGGHLIQLRPFDADMYGDCWHCTVCDHLYS